MNLALLTFIYKRYIDNDDSGRNDNNKILTSNDVYTLTGTALDQYKCENVAISREIEAKDIENNKIPIKNIIGDHPKLFIRFTGIGCSNCLSSFEKELKQVISQIKNENIIFLFSVKNTTELNALRNLYRIESPVYLIEKGSLPFLVENQEDIIALFFFILDDDLKSKHFYIPITGFNDFTTKYCELINSRYF